jgi:ABC-type oligopeptide transport system substrate-binding subunit
MEVEMIHRTIGFAGLAFACALSLGSTLTAQAQGQSTTTKDQTTTTRTETQSSDSSNWQAPRGYDEAYPENGTPNMVARQGYAAGFSQGEADASRGKKFNPTESDAYAHAKIPKGMDKDAFKMQFRESFVKGYTAGFKKV